MLTFYTQTDGHMGTMGTSKSDGEENFHTIEIIIIFNCVMSLWIFCIL